MLIGNNDIKFTGNWGETFYGFSFGLFNEFRFGHKRKNGINLGIILPIRSEEFNKRYDELVESEYYEVSTVFPVLVSIGFHVEFKR